MQLSPACSTLCAPGELCMVTAHGLCADWRPQPGARPLHTFTVTTTAGTATVVAQGRPEAITMGLELTNPRATVLSCVREGDW